MQPMPMADLVLDLQPSQADSWQRSWPLCLARYLRQRLTKFKQGGAKHD